MTAYPSIKEHAIKTGVALDPVSGLDQIIFASHSKQIRIIPFTARHGVPASATTQDVLSFPSMQRIRAIPSHEQVVAMSTVQDIVSCLARQHVIAIAAIDLIITAACDWITCEVTRTQHFTIGELDDVGTISWSQKSFEK